MTHQQALGSMAAERYLLDEMSDLERHRFEAHYFDCADCAEDLRHFALLRPETFAEESATVPERQHAREAPSRLSGGRSVLPWALAATLTLVAGDQSFMVIPSLRRLMAPQSLAPVALTTASRGEQPVVTVEDDRGFVSLAIDVDPDLQSIPRLSYGLMRASGAIVASGEAPLPAPGMPLLLLIPAASINAPGDYVLSLRDPARPNDSTVEYRFAVANPDRARVSVR